MVNPVDSRSMAQFQSIIIRSRIRLCARMYPSVLLPQASHSVSALNTSHLQLCKNFPRAGRQVVATPYHLVRRVESRLLLLSSLGSIAFQPPSNSGFASTAGPPKARRGPHLIEPFSLTPRHRLCRSQPYLQHYLDHKSDPLPLTALLQSSAAHFAARGPLHSTHLSKIPLRPTSDSLPACPPSTSSNSTLIVSVPRPNTLGQD